MPYMRIAYCTTQFIRSRTWPRHPGIPPFRNLPDTLTCWLHPTIVSDHVPPERTTNTHGCTERSLLPAGMRHEGWAQPKNLPSNFKCKNQWMRGDACDGWWISNFSRSLEISNIYTVLVYAILLMIITIIEIYIHHISRSRVLETSCRDERRKRFKNSTALGRHLAIPWALGFGSITLQRKTDFAFHFLSNDIQLDYHHILSINSVLKQQLV